jgi:hypothetical protein
MAVNTWIKSRHCAMGCYSTTLWNDYVLKLIEYKMSVLSAILCRVPGTSVPQLTVIPITLSYYMSINFFLVNAVLYIHL